MEDESNKTENIYPISKNNRKCVGPCYEPNKYIIHPINLDFVTGNNNKPFCPTNVYEGVDDDGTKYKSFVDECFKITNNNETQVDMLTPNITFDHNSFLITYYNINSYEKVIKWLRNNVHLPLKTKLRLLECMWVAHHDNIFIIDSLIINIYNDLFIDNILTIYNKLSNYVDVDQDKIQFKKTSLPTSKHSIERINFIKEKLINEEEVNKFLNKYFEKNKNDITKLEKYFNTNNIIEEFTNYLLAKLSKSL